jgi:hypothetical protein
MTWEVLIQSPTNSNAFVASGLPNFVGSFDDANSYVIQLQIDNPGKCYALTYVSG